MSRLVSSISRCALWGMAILAAALHPSFVLAADAGQASAPRELCVYEKFDSWIARDAAEADCMRSFGDKATRSGERLAVHRDNGHQREFVDERRACDARDPQFSAEMCRIFTFMGYIPEINSTVVRKTCYEGCNDHFIIPQDDGDTVRGEGVPRLSPGRTRLIVILDTMEAETPYIQLFEIRGGKLVPGLLSEQEGEWRLAGWDGEDVVNLEVRPYNTDIDCANEWHPMKLAKAAEKWAFTSPMPCKGM